MGIELIGETNLRIATLKEDLWCSYCGNKNFYEIPDELYMSDSRYSAWECSKCHAVFEDNPGYGWYISFWGIESNRNKDDVYSLHTGELLDRTKLPRTPEGIIRHSGSKEELEKYLSETQVQ